MKIKNIFIPIYLLCFSFCIYLNNDLGSSNKQDNLINNDNIKQNSLGGLENGRYMFNDFIPIISDSNGLPLQFRARDVSSHFKHDKFGFVSSYEGLIIAEPQNANDYSYTNYSTYSNNSNNVITGDNFIAAAFNNDTSEIAVASHSQGILLGESSNNSPYAFRNYNTSENNIDSDAGSGIDFTNTGKILYVSDNTTNGGLSVGTKSSDTYTFAKYGVGTTGISTNVMFSVAGNQTNDDIVIGSNDGIIVGTWENNDYTFRTYNNSVTGIPSNEIISVSMDNNGDIVAVPNNGGLVFGKKPANPSDPYTFTNYTHDSNNQDSIVSDNGISTSIGNNGDIAYSSDLGLSIGTNDGSDNFSFTNYTSQNPGDLSIGSSATVRYGSDNDLIYSTTDNGFSIGTNTVTASIDTNNIVYEPNLRNLGNYTIENFSISTNFALNKIITSTTFIQTTITDTNSNKCFIGYITNDGVTPANADPDYSSYLRQITVMSTSSYSISFDLDIDNANGTTDGFAPGDDINVSVKYGQDQSSLTEALPSTGNTITMPSDKPTEDYDYVPQSFSPTLDNFSYDNDTNKYYLRNGSMSFGKDLSEILTSNGDNYIQIVVYKDDSSKLSNIVSVNYVVNSTNTNPGLPSNHLEVDDNTFVKVLNISSESDKTIVNGLEFKNLAQDQLYKIKISLGSSQDFRQDMIPSTSNSYLSFTTPTHSVTPPPNHGGGDNNNGNARNEAAVIGGVVGGSVGIVGIGTGAYFFMRRGSKKR